MAFLILAGCGDVSNSLFDEDADFVAALPANERLVMRLPEGDGPALLDTTIGVADGLAGLLADLVAAVDEVRSLPPGARTDTSRVWGPYAWQGVDVVASVVRDGASRFDWSFTGTHDTHRELVFLTGTHYVGETIASGDGHFTWDHAAFGTLFGEDTSGTFTVEYDARDGADLLFDLAGLASDGAEPETARHGYRYIGEEGDFQIRVEDVDLRTRWKGDGGRADAGDGEWTQCWDADLTLVYDSLGEGDLATCVYADLANVDRL